MVGSMPAPETPVLVGAGQVTRWWDGAGPASAPSPLRLQQQAVEAALADTGVDAGRLLSLIDRLYVVRAMLDSIPGARQPFGRPANPPRALARVIGASPSHAIYSIVGGDQPQVLVSEAAAAIAAGEAGCVLIAGSEATAAMKTAQRAGVVLDWSDETDGPAEDRGLGPDLTDAYEVRNGLGMPTQTYPAFEHALRGRLGLDRTACRDLMSELWAAFSRVAADNPHAQFAQARSRGFLATESADNYPIADPYLKWHVAQDAVNQGAAVLLTSTRLADTLGIPHARRVYLHGTATVRDRLPTLRPDLSRSRAMELALAATLDMAGLDVAALDHVDLYSCFPCAVLLAAEALGLDWRQKVPTVTGGLPFFGGAGNNYSLHAIATMMERVRQAPGSFGLVLANGGYLSKEAAGIYSCRPSALAWPVSSASAQQALDAEACPERLTGACTATVETYTVVHARGRAVMGYVIATSAQGRILARTRNGDAAMLAALGACDPLGARVTIGTEGDVNVLLGLEPASPAG